MALTAEDMTNIKELLDEVFTRRVDAKYEPRFDAIDRRFDAIDARFEAVDRRFDRIEVELGALRDDMGVMKEMAKDHSFEIARLKHRTA